jgi:tagatose 6-phosphate kinase
LHTRGAESVVITAGAGPALAFDGDRFWQVTSPRVRALNPIGSGDAFTAGLVDKLVGGCDLVQACRWAAGAGAANAMTCMAGELDRHEVERLASFVDIQAL